MRGRVGKSGVEESVLVIAVPFAAAQCACRKSPARSRADFLRMHIHAVRPQFSRCAHRRDFFKNNH
jgi:hypothetical protein